MWHYHNTVWCNNLKTNSNFTLQPRHCENRFHNSNSKKICGMWILWMCWYNSWCNCYGVKRFHCVNEITSMKINTYLKLCKYGGVLDHMKLHKFFYANWECFYQYLPKHNLQKLLQGFYYIFLHLSVKLAPIVNQTHSSHCSLQS